MSLRVASLQPLSEGSNSAIDIGYSTIQVCRMKGTHVVGLILMFEIMYRVAAYVCSFRKRRKPHATYMCQDHLYILLCSNSEVNATGGFCSFLSLTYSTK
jgi:hypothetical protein